MAYAAIDLTEAWAVDIPTNVLTTLTSTQFVVSSMHVKDDNAWLMYDARLNTFGGTAGSQTKTRFKVNFSSWASGMASGLCGFSTKVGNRDAQKDYAGSDLDSVGITVVDSGGNPRFRIDEHTAGIIATQLFTGSLSTGTTYYVEMDFNPALGANGRVTVSIWTSSYGGTLVESQTIDVAGSHSAYSFYYPFLGNNDNGAGAVSGTFTVDDPETDGITLVDSSQMPRNQQGNRQNHSADYTQVDGGAIVWTVGANQLDGAGDDHREDSYSHKATAASITADYDCFMKIIPTSISGGWRGWFLGLSDTIGSLQDIIDASGNCIALAMEATSTTLFRVRVDAVDAGTQTATNGTGGLAENKAWWVKLALDYDGGGGQGQAVVTACEDHPDSVRPQDTATLNLTTQRTYTKMQGFLALGNAAAGSQTASFTSSDMFFSFEASISQSVDTDVEFTSLGDFLTTTTMSASADKTDLGGKSIIRDGGSNRIWTLGINSLLGSTVAVYTPSDGVTWVPETAASTFAADGHAITIGAGGEPVAVLHKAGQTDLQVWARASGGGWTKKATVGAGNNNAINAFGIHYDGTLYHLVYMDKAGTSVGANVRCRLRHRTSTNLTSWTSATTVDAGHKDGPFGGSKAMAAAMDRVGDIHVIYGLANSSGEQKLNYIIYDESAGTWGTSEEIENFGANFLNGDRLLHIDLALDTNNKPHFVGVIEADAILGTSNGFSSDDIFATFYWEKTGASWSTALELDVKDSTVLANYNPTIFLNSGTTPIVYWGSQTTSGGELKRAVKSGGGWSRSLQGTVDQFGINAFDYDCDAAQYARTNGGHLVNGDFLYLQGSLIMIQTTATTWADGTTLVESIPTFSQAVGLKGFAYPTTDFEVSQAVGLNFGYNRAPSGDAEFSATVPLLNYDRKRTVTRTPQLSSDVGLWFVPFSGTTLIYKNVTENRLNFSAQARALIQTIISTNIEFSHEINLTLNKNVPAPFEVRQDIDLMVVKLLTAEGDTLISDVVFMNKELNLGVSTGIEFSTTGLPIRDWNAYSTHFNPGWGTEDSTTQVVFLHPSSLPTTSLTMMRPEFGDVRNDKRRSGSVRRNRTGQPRTFKVPVYSSFVLNWTGIPRFIAEEFRTRIISYFGDELRYQDHNGVFHNVIITDTALVRNQSNHEHVNLSLTLEKSNRVDLAPTIAG